MGYVRGTIFFADTRSYAIAGWSETHVNMTADISLPAAIGQLAYLGQLRQAMLAPGIIVGYLRVSNDEIFRDSQILPGLAPLIANIANQAGQLTPTGGQPPSSGNPGPAFAPGNPLFALDNPDMPWTAVLCRGEGPAPFNSRAMFWVTGLPDELTFSQNRGITDPTWVQAFNAWKGELIQNYGFLGQNNTSTNPAIRITNVDIHQLRVQITTNDNHGLVDGDMTLIRGVKTINQLGKAVNGRWQILKTDNTHFDLIGSQVIPAFQYLQGGTSRKQVKTFFRYTNILQRRFGQRKRGRPFDVLIGRQRAKKRVA
jgi:hypothetical protein